ncbi:hypothetical protein [Brevibacillus massiliensis]|jgi:hypothetical protein|uniref:hypothetical protein n=1 Tax=Brevibacillus massiliensis TaxID=1118054 RepID=UPI000310BD78|nr:hypothetical protein [Brevibacillus massiliensis]
MSHVSLTLPNTTELQAFCRAIRDCHREREQPLAIRFSEQATHIVLEGPVILLPMHPPLPKEAKIVGTVKQVDNRHEIHPQEKGKTINLHLDSELVAELEQIRRHVARKTQHEVILEMFVRGLRSFQQEHPEEGKKP